MWVYQARLVKVVDGDTVDMLIDQGFRVQITQRVRLLGVDAPERDTPEGKAAKAWVTEWFTVTGAARALLGQGLWPYEVTTHKPARDKYDRWVAEIWCKERSITQELLNTGIALPWPAR